jgi:hypothetical protein
MRTAEPWDKVKKTAQSEEQTKRPSRTCEIRSVGSICVPIPSGSTQPATARTDSKVGSRQSSASLDPLRREAIVLGSGRSARCAATPRNTCRRIQDDRLIRRTDCARGELSRLRLRQAGLEHQVVERSGGNLDRPYFGAVNLWHGFLL